MLIHKSSKHTDEVALPHVLDTSLLHSLTEHALCWLTDEWYSAIITISETLKEILNAKNLDDSLSVVDVGIGEEPHLALGSVDLLKKLSQHWVWLKNVLEWKSIVDLAVVLQWVNLVVTYESFDGETVVLVVFLVQAEGLRLVKVQVLHEVLINELAHVVVHIPVCLVVSNVQMYDSMGLNGSATFGVKLYVC